MISKKEKWFNILSFINEEYIIEADPLKFERDIPVRKMRESKAKSSSEFRGGVMSITSKKIVFAACACSIIAAILIGIFVLFFSNSPVTAEKLEWGFVYEEGDEIPSDSCAYRSESNVFDIDDVTLTFYFGGVFSPEIEQEHEFGRNIPEFDVYFGDANLAPMYTIRHSTDNFVSEEYRVTWVFDESYNVTEMIYNHSEEITIPQSIFSEEQGVIRFCVGGTNINEVEQEYKTIACAYISYKIVDGKVKLSPWDGNINQEKKYES